MLDRVERISYMIICVCSVSMYFLVHCNMHVIIEVVSLVLCMVHVCTEVCLRYLVKCT